MISAFKCRAYAEECRTMAKRIAGARQEAMTMAEIWDALARETEAACKHKKVLEARQSSSGPVEALRLRVMRQILSH